MSQAIPLLQRAIRDTCMDFYPVRSLEEADTVITLEALQKDILNLLRLKIDEKEKETITLTMLKSELTRNNFYSTSISNSEGTMEVWLVRKK